MLVSSRTGGVSVEFESFNDGSSEKRQASLEALVMSLGQESRERRFTTLFAMVVIVLKLFTGDPWSDTCREATSA